MRLKSSNRLKEVPIKQYEELLERAEDAEDVASLKRARKRRRHYRARDMSDRERKAYGRK
jgi:hypothetical protein